MKENYVVFYKNKAKITEVIEKLDEHFPHSGVSLNAILQSD